MKRIIALALSCAIVLSGCGQTVVESKNDIELDAVSKTESIENTMNEESNAEVVFDSKVDKETEIENEQIIEDDGFGDVEPDFGDLNNPELLQYIEDDIYADLSDQLGSEDYIIEGVDAIFVSKEFLEESEFNSKSNIYFGYTLEELDEQFQGTRYVFTLGEDGKTTVEPFEEYDDTYDQVIKNVAVGSGVIIVCVTVSVVSAGTGAPACISMVFAAAAKTGTACALSGGVLSSVAAGTITAYKTGDMDAALKDAVLKGSEGFKWGAITGAITGGAGKALKLVKSANTIHTPRESELTVLERTKGATEQLSYIDGKEVPLNTQGATRPDVVVKNADGTIQAIEVKNYNLSNASNRGKLYRELERQVTSRVKNLPKGSTQKIVLDVRGRNFPDELVEMVMKNIHLRCDGVYPNIPIELLAY